ncbi:TraR/DksA family transcriptional regulator [uncultured Marinobacter sp.]|uniref:TraR/DksA family transcriptional regulator n=1 Tax=uncultured Marinobacter sp. TaxID=187379 RepID=UPI0030DA52B8|tara:strand:+ start:264 stop:593 length:330 start_codon:yes stop_codon:yes gene_type:complete
MNDRKSELEKLKAELSERLSRYEKHQHRTDGALDPDFSEQAVQRQNDEVVDSLDAEVRSELQQIQHALERIEQGIGSQCERCGEDIAAERLKVLPYTSFCVRCAEAISE